MIRVYVSKAFHPDMAGFRCLPGAWPSEALLSLSASAAHRPALRLRARSLLAPQTASLLPVQRPTQSRAAPVTEPSRCCRCRCRCIRRTNRRRRAASSAVRTSQRPAPIQSRPWPWPGLPRGRPSACRQAQPWPARGRIRRMRIASQEILRVRFCSARFRSPRLSSLHISGDGQQSLLRGTCVVGYSCTREFVAFYRRT